MRLAGRITFGQPANSSLVDHVYRFDSLQRPPCALKRTVALCQPDPFLDSPVILLHYIIEVLALTQADTASYRPLGLQGGQGCRIGWVLVPVHDAWDRIAQ